MSSANITYNLNFNLAANRSSSTSKFALKNRNTSLLPMSLYSANNRTESGETHADDKQNKPAFLPRLPEKVKQCWNETTHLINDYYLTSDTKCDFSKVTDLEIIIFFRNNKALL